MNKSNTSTRPSDLAQRIIRSLGMVMLLSLPVISGHAATLSWSGGGATDNWGDSANWGGVGTPAAGDTLIFGAIATAHVTSSNNIASRVLNQIQFRGASGGFVLYGQPLSVTNSIQATNSAGAVNTISNTVTLATSDVTINVSNSASLKIAGQVAGTVGMTKTGRGTLIYQYSASNGYNGTTRVNAGTLQLNVGGTSAFGGDLVIGDDSGSGNPTVQLLQGSEISSSAAITIYLNGTLDLNNYSEAIGNSLTLHGATITTGTGTLTLGANCNITMTSGSSYIYGLLNNGSGTLTLQGPGSLFVYADMTGSANIVQDNGSGVVWSGNNTHSGSYTANGVSPVHLWNSLALGKTTNQMTLNANAQVFLRFDVNITNQSLTINSTNAAAIRASGASGASTNTWTSSFTLGSVAGVSVDTNCALSLIGAIGGAGGLTKTEPGLLTYAGSSANTYSGATTVTDGTLLLAKSVSNGGVVGSALTIGDGTGAANSAVVRDSGAAQISTTPDIIINTEGLLDLNNISEAVGNSLTLNGGEIQTGTGTLTLAAGAAITNSGSSTVSGALGIGSGTCTVQGSGVLYLYADVSGSANIVKNGSVSLYFTGANTFSGLLTANSSGILYLNSSTALGGTNYGTILNDSTYLYLYPDVNITNETLTLNTTASAAIRDFSGETNTWIATNFTLSADATINVATNSWLLLKGPISGAGGITKTGPGTLALSGSGNNTYSGETVVNEGVLALDKASGWAVGAGSLTIGDGVGGNSVDIVRYTGGSGSEINTLPITINSSGLLDLNGKTDILGRALTLNTGEIQTGAGTLALASNASITNSGNASVISGNFDVGSGTCTMTGTEYLIIYANVSGTANIVKNGSFSLRLAGDNTFSGTLTANNTGDLFLTKDTSLGGTNSGTILNDTAHILLYGNLNITNESLTLNSTSRPCVYLYSGYTNTWSCTNITLVADAIIEVATNAALELKAPIGGAGGVTKIGPGRLVYSGGADNTYDGLTRLNEGELDFAKTGNRLAIPYASAGLVIGDGVGTDTVRYYGNQEIWSLVTPVTLTNSAVMDLNGFYDGAGPLTLNGGEIKTGAGFFAMGNTVQIGGSSTMVSGKVRLDTATVVFSNTTSSVLYMNASVYGASASWGITKDGNNAYGQLYLTGSNSYGGLTLVKSGMLWAQNPWALGTTTGGTVVSNLASLILNGGIGITNESLNLNGPGIDSGYGALDVENGINTWAGPITNNANSTLDAWNPGSELHINGPISGAGGLKAFGYWIGGGSIYFEGTAANTYAGATTVDQGCTLVLNKTVDCVPGNLTNNGTVRWLGDNQIANSANVTINGTGLLDFNGNYDRFNALSGSGNMQFGAGGYAIPGHAGATSTFDGVASGDGYIWKVGGGVLTLNGNNTYLRQTFVEAGTLLVNGDQHQSSVAVGSGAFLGGSGTVGTILGNGNVAPGSSPGILSCSNMTFSSLGTYRVDITGPNAGTDYDQLNVRGTNNLANAHLNLSAVFTDPVAVGQQFVIIKNDGTDANVGTFLGWPEGTNSAQGGYAATISYVGGAGGNDVVLTLTSIPGAVASAAVTSGNGSHGIDPNGCNNLNLAITNTSGVAMTGVNATLSTTTRGVLITQPYSAYANIAASRTGTNTTPFQISTLPSFVCGDPINLQLSVDSSLGAFTMNYVLNSGEPSVTPARFDVTGNVAIPDPGTVDSTLFVSGVVGPLQKVVVSLYVTHPFDADLSLSLVAPDGTTVLLSAANGGGGADYGSGLTPDSSRTTFDDAGATAIASGTAPFVGTYRPQSPLSAFAGNLNPNGNWKLRLADGFGGSSGTLRGWSLFLYGTSCSPGSGACDYCLTSISGSITNTDLILTNRIARNGVLASCGAPKIWPGIAGSSGGTNHHYDAYLFTNTTAADACVTVLLTAGCNVQAGVYLNAFNPFNIATNYLGDSGDSTGTDIHGGYGGGPQSCSVNVPAGARFIVTVNEIVQNSGCSGYTLQLSGLPCPPPTLRIQPVPPNKARLYWDTSAGGYVLEAVPYLGLTNWTRISNEPIVSGGDYNVTNTTVLPPNRFYRLHKP